MYWETYITNHIFFYIEIKKKKQIMGPTIIGSSGADFAQCQQVKRCAEAFGNDLQVSKQ